ncbi:MAG: hypothetical protein C0190_07165 [Thermodesulfobacterium geofontis]|uniref:Uncharacterized protein n=1 Tax=Thermodesulfobacterium geofontis TaxID=1295609 RepID=A0A2N7PLP2_9BACT|nr:MAG: hypothetical protein C0190_07165 [Thermodesulfobacterium geofontis]
MERGTFISKFTKLADEIKEKYGVSIWLVEILGRRRSFVAGHKEDAFLPPEEIFLNEKFAVVSNEWEKIPQEEKEKFLNTLKKELEK